MRLIPLPQMTARTRQCAYSLDLGLRRYGLSRSLLFIVVAAALVALAPGAYAANQADPNLSKLEVKFFQHEYPKDTIEQRLERLEKMVFGETRTGSTYERLSNLLATVPNLNPKVADEEEAAPADSGPAPGQQGKGRQQTARDDGDDNYQVPDGSKYPAVTAIENRLFGKDFASEAINKRLERLELKVFGRVSGTGDLSERVDNLKQRTGIDIARQAPPGSDWADEDDDGGAMPQDSPIVDRGGEDGLSFSGRDLRKDLQKAYGLPPSAGLTSGRFSGSYGMGDTSAPAPLPPRASAPGYAPPRGMTSAPPPSPDPVPSAPAMGLNQQVGALETEIFGRSYGRDPLPARLNRLEATVFPQDKPAVDKALPERVNRLLSVIPLSRQAQSKQVAQGQRQRNDEGDFDDLSEMGMATGQQSTPRASSGLGKIINSISGFLTGGMVGGYPMGFGGGNFVNDPQTGMLYDTTSGNLVDPVTGVVVGQRMAPNMNMAPGSFGSFGSGFSPYGAMPYGTGLGIGSGSGMRFGFGSGMGNYGYRMWP